MRSIIVLLFLLLLISPSHAFSPAFLCSHLHPLPHITPSLSRKFSRSSSSLSYSRHSLPIPALPASTSSSSSSSLAGLDSSLPKSISLLSSITSHPLTKVIATTFVIGGGVRYYNQWKADRVIEEDNRREAFKTLMGLSTKRNDDVDQPFDFTAPYTFDNEEVNKPITASSKPVITKLKQSITTQQPAPGSSTSNLLKNLPPKKSSPLSSMFQRAKPKLNIRETDINVLLTSDDEFSRVLAEQLTFGAPGRFIQLEQSLNVTGVFNLTESRVLLETLRADLNMTNVQAAEGFAHVVNSMLITIIDLSSSSLGEKTKDNDVVVKAMDVVLDFMDHCGGLYDSIAGGVVIKSVVYEGSLTKSVLEEMYTAYIGSTFLKTMMMTEEKAADENENDDGYDGSSDKRSERLQSVFGISDEKAQKLMEKCMMKSVMNMKNGDNEDQLKEMISSFANNANANESGKGGFAEALKSGMPKNSNGKMPEIKPEELKESLKILKQLIDSKAISKSEISSIRENFKKDFGGDLSEMLGRADLGSLGGDEKELLSLFKEIMG